MQLAESYIEMQDRRLAKIKGLVDNLTCQGWNLDVQYLINQFEGAVRWSVPAIRYMLARIVREGNFWYAAKHVVTQLPKKDQAKETENIMRECLRAKRYQEARTIVPMLPEALQARYRKRLVRKERINMLLQQFGLT